MFDSILFPTDGSEGAAAALDHALDLAADSGATLHVLNVVDTGVARGAGVNSALGERRRETGEEFVAAAAERAADRGVETVTAMEEGEPHREIVAYADDHADLVVMPTHGRRGLERLLLGSTTERVVRRSDVPVLTLRPGEDARVRYPYRDVLVPTDGSEPASAALALGVDVVTGTGAALHLLSVVDVASLGIDVRTGVQVDFLEERAESTLDEAADRAREAGVESVTETVGFAGSIHRNVLEYVDDNDVDLLVVGTHGTTGVDRYLLGSVTEKLVRTAPVPVLTVRGPHDD
ncbi:universal stress protein [Halorarius halobius]|uniref:universal stress protein n=1 Tax=Halorarius halobius TaxID=2962671 RepID=UPI0020CD2730|nr:universal stress protein [Halorarius halobius]